MFQECKKNCCTCCTCSPVIIQLAMEVNCAGCNISILIRASLVKFHGCRRQKQPKQKIEDQVKRSNRRISREFPLCNAVFLLIRLCFSSSPASCSAFSLFLSPSSYSFSPCLVLCPTKPAIIRFYRYILYILRRTRVYWYKKMYAHINSLSHVLSRITTLRRNFSARERSGGSKILITLLLYCVRSSSIALLLHTQ